MLDPTARALRLLSLLQTHRFWPGSELASELEVSPRTLRRDIDRLRELGYPVDATTGSTGGYRLAAGSHMPPLLLDDDEAVAIAIGLRAAATSAMSGIEETALRALVKLEQVLPDRLRRRVGALHSNMSVLRSNVAEDLVDPEALALLAQACRDLEEARFDYVRRDGETSARLVQPHHLVSVGRRWYLVAWDVRRDDWRTFRLDRLARPRLAGSRFAERSLPGGDPADFVARSLRQTPMAHNATVIVTATPAELADIAHWLDAEAEPIDATHCRLELRAEQSGWLVSMITTLAIRFPVQVTGSEELSWGLLETASRLADSIPPRSPRLP